MQEVLAAENLKKVYGKNTVLDGFYLNLYAGSIYGLAGNNGAGKTTFMRIIMGLAHENEGSYRLFGKDKEDLSPADRRKVSAIIETPTFYPHMTGYQNLKIHQLEIGDKVDKQKIYQVLEKVDILKSANKKVRTYSLGMKQRLGIARALLSNAELIILDEPTNGLDPAGIAQLNRLIQDLNKNYGKTFLITSHHIAELVQLVHQVGIIKNGKLKQELLCASLKEQGIHIEEYIIKHME